MTVIHCKQSSSQHVQGIPRTQTQTLKTQGVQWFSLLLCAVHSYTAYCSLLCAIKTRWAECTPQKACVGTQVNSSWRQGLWQVIRTKQDCGVGPQGWHWWLAPCSVSAHDTLHSLGCRGVLSSQHHALMLPSCRATSQSMSILYKSPGLRCLVMLTENGSRQVRCSHLSFQGFLYI